MKRSKKRTVITKDTEFHGFLDNMDIVEAGKKAGLLRRENIPTFIIIDGIEKPTEKEIVEELVSRNAVFMTGLEAKAKAPWCVVHTDLYFCQFECKDNEQKPKNPAWDNKDWISVSVVQYEYAQYLQSIKKKPE